MGSSLVGQPTIPVAQPAKTSFPHPLQQIPDIRRLLRKRIHGLAHLPRTDPMRHFKREEVDEFAPRMAEEMGADDAVATIYD